MVPHAVQGGSHLKRCVIIVRNGLAVLGLRGCCWSEGLFAGQRRSGWLPVGVPGRERLCHREHCL